MWSSKLTTVAVFLTILSITVAAIIIKEHSLSPPYTKDAENLIFWELADGAQLADSFIRLTTDEAEKQGSIWNVLPCLSNNWEFQTKFHIHGKGVNLNGHGMALWYVRDPKQTGPVFGYTDYFIGLGVFIDTFENERNPHKHRHPYISAMVNNGSLHYEHDEDGTMTQIGGCSAPIRNLDVPTRIAVSYVDYSLGVYLDYEGSGQWKLCFKAQGVYLPSGYFFGASARTSDLTDNHDILAISTLNLDDPNKVWENRMDIIPHAENIQIPERYVRHSIEEEVPKVEPKISIEEELQKVEHERKVVEEELQKVQHERKVVDEELQKVQHERQVVEEQQQKVEHERKVVEEVVEDQNAEEDELDGSKTCDSKGGEVFDTGDKVCEATEAKAVDAEDEVSPPSMSLLRKLIYITGAVIIIMVAISMYRKYAERRREIMHKRLF